ncbi:hypothetical protein P9112_011848 [Eukaryota sp. TZLM1-RC]
MLSPIIQWQYSRKKLVNLKNTLQTLQKRLTGRCENNLYNYICSSAVLNQDLHSLLLEKGVCENKSSDSSLFVTIVPQRFGLCATDELTKMRLYLNIPINQLLSKEKCICSNSPQLTLRHAMNCSKLPAQTIPVQEEPPKTKFIIKLSETLPSEERNMNIYSTPSVGALASRRASCEVTPTQASVVNPSIPTQPLGTNVPRNFLLHTLGLYRTPVTDEEKLRKRIDGKLRCLVKLNEAFGAKRCSTFEDIMVH